MRKNGAGSSKSVTFSPNKLERLPINRYKLSDAEIRIEYPDIGDKEYRKTKRRFNNIFKNLIQFIQ